jgi:HSP20 family molecular chaperone IbpA
MSSKNIVEIMKVIFEDNYKAMQPSPAKSQSSSSVKSVRKLDEETIIIKVPGFAKEDLSIKIEKSTMTISGVAKLVGDDGNVWFTSTVSESVQLSSFADVKNITATVVNGLLKIVVPRKKQEQSSVKINIL